MELLVGWEQEGGVSVETQPGKIVNWKETWCRWKIGLVGKYISLASLRISNSTWKTKEILKYKVTINSKNKKILKT